MTSSGSMRAAAAAFVALLTACADRPAATAPIASPVAKPAEPSAPSDARSIDSSLDTEAPESFTEPEIHGEPVPQAWRRSGVPSDTTTGESAPPRRADSAFDSHSYNDVIGIGGGAGPVGTSQRLLSRRQVAKTWKPSQLAPNTMRMKVGDDEELPIEGMQFQVRVDGFRARVLVDFHVRNDGNRLLEGTFQLRLPSGASPWFLAFGENVVPTKATVVGDNFFAAGEARTLGFDARRIMDDRARRWREPREARIVRRDTAVHAYERTVRRRVDPALLEWSGAGVFDARVFPIQPRRSHRVVFAYDVDLQALGDDLELRLDVPADVPRCVVDLNVAAGGDFEAEVEPAVDADIDSGRRFYHFDEAREPIRVRLHRAEDTVLVGESRDTGPFFAMRVTPEAEAPPIESSDRATFLVDTSLSSSKIFAIWLELLAGILDKNRDAIREFSVLFFNVECHWWQQRFVENNAANVRALVDYANELVLEGATDLESALREANGAAWRTRPVDLFLLSDGSASWGRRKLGDLVAATKDRLFAYRTGLSGEDERTLHALARATGGGVFSVVGETEIAKAARAHRAPPFVIAGVELGGCKDVLVVGDPKTVFRGQRLLVTGRGRPAAGKSLVLRLARAGKEIVHEIPVGDVLESELAPRIYGHEAVARLEQRGRKIDPARTAYATHFRVVGDTCSLLMLDSEADYRRFDIPTDNGAKTVASTDVTTLGAPFAERSEHSGRKAELLARIHSLEYTPSVAFRLPDSVERALAGMDESVFAIEPERLACKLRRRSDVPEKFVEQLAGGSPDPLRVRVEAKRRFEAGAEHDAVRALSSLLELEPGSHALAREAGYTTLRYGLPGQACQLFAGVQAARPHEPHAWREMGLCLARGGRTELALVCFEVAAAAKWDQRFHTFPGVLAMDYAAVASRLDAAGRSKLAFVDARLDEARGQYGELLAGPHDVVVIISWNTDRTDVDLMVKEPGGEVCYYQNPKTRGGGLLTGDVTTGFGPEMYVCSDAKVGTYVISVVYYSNDAFRRTTRSRVHARVVRNWGRPDERTIEEVVTLQGTAGEKQVARIHVGR